jgi:4-hydroxybenzoate polyprenyltransferase
VPPVRLRDRPLGFFLSNSLPPAITYFFAYASATQRFYWPPLILLGDAFFYLNHTMILVKDVPDIDADKATGARNFTLTFGVKATRNVVLACCLGVLMCFLVLVATNTLSVLGLPILLLSLGNQLRYLVRDIDALRDRHIVYGKVIAGVLINTMAFFAGSAGKLYL